jgi:hypothetical protein
MALVLASDLNSIISELYWVQHGSAHMYYYEYNRDLMGQTNAAVTSVVSLLGQLYIPANH